MIISQFNNPKYNDKHPFKVGLRTILVKHFSLGIVKNFQFILEVEKFKADDKRGKHIKKQIDDQNFICEVYYQKESGIMVYITDIYSWWSKAQCEAALLRFITDKVRTGQIGEGWIDNGGQVSEDVRSGKYETPDAAITKYMSHNAKKKGEK